MIYLKKYDSYNSIETNQSEKTEENLKFIKDYFTDIPLTLEQYKERPHIFTFESRLNGKLVGSCISVLRDFKANTNEISIPDSIEYNLPRVHINYIRTLEELMGRGIGKEIVSKIMEWSKLNNVGIITANVKVDNIKSQRLFKSCQFNKSDKLTSNGSNTFYFLIK
jgi:RimJ/RimL family protein N-acetyltransferase